MRSKFVMPAEAGEFKVDTAINVISHKGRKVFAISGDTALLDVAARSSVVTANHQFLDQLVEAVKAAGLQLRYVKDVKAFFNPEERWQTFMATGVVEGIDLTDEERALVDSVAELRKRFDTAFTLPVTYIYYERLPVLEGKNPLAGFVIGTNRVHKRGRSGYAVTFKQLEVLWKEASKKWAAGKTGKLPYRNIAGYSHYPSVGKNGIKFGCQTIPRAALEAFAAQKGWPDPIVEA